MQFLEIFQDGRDDRRGEGHVQKHRMVHQVEELEGRGTCGGVVFRPNAIKVDLNRTHDEVEAELLRGLNEVLHVLPSLIQADQMPIVILQRVRIVL